MADRIWADALEKIKESGQPYSPEAFGDLIARAQAASKAEGAREAIERIRHRFEAEVFEPAVSGIGFSLHTSRLWTILDEEAAK